MIPDAEYFIGLILCCNTLVLVFNRDRGRDVDVVVDVYEQCLYEWK